MCNIASYKFSDHLLCYINIIVIFFNNSHIAGAKLKQLIEKDNIKDDRLRLYCKICWTTLNKSVNSVLNLKLVLEKIVKDYLNLLFNSKIKVIIEGQNF
ncbi:hypothetical protein Glove_467g1 [Diversispora epigaea]|uniref:Uncharacterized protein n=1 Tax=Diversispora epigaea TaxID=1348612 RepID=A0A397GQM0_9GLOM|nr:hypothetical protein Glove_467g1 [Diversispora epigaea]